MGDISGVDVDVAPYAPRSVLESLPCTLPESQFEADIDFEEVASSSVDSLNHLDRAAILPSSIWRDVFALTGSIRTFYSSESIVNAWTETCSNRQAGEFSIVKGSAKPIRIDKDIGWVNLAFTFRNRAPPAAQCHGFLSLVLDQDRKWKIWLLRTVLEQLEGCDDVDQLVPIQEASTNGVHPHTTDGVDGNHQPSVNGKTDSPKHFDCIVVGGGQAGLSTAGRLQALGISYVVLDKHAKIGDNWMTRYDSARLHTAREYNHLPFDRTFPLPYQEYLTKYDLARGYKDWVEKFGIGKNIWFGTTLESGSRDESQRTWTLLVRRGEDDSTQTLTCRYLVMATGGGGQIPIMPTYPGREDFQGTILHSAEYKSAEAWRGKAGVVVGTANTAHDVAEDMAEAGLSSVTMVQRTRTYVLPCEYFKVISDRSYNADVPIIDADREGYSMPYVISRLLSRKALHAAAATEPERFDALEKAGFKVERYGDIMYHILEKLGGHYMDVGCSDKIARGLIKMKAGALPTHYTRTGLAFSDGTEIPADVIIFSTGFVGNVRTDVGQIFGKEIASRADDFWTLDEEGELKGVYKRNSQPDLFYMGGTIGHSRYFSRFPALQIKADLMGTPLPVYDGERRKQTVN
ncbi:hypothetical protein LTR99_010461 [Exophiala xenobiotica]|uniref:Flavin-containing monooxygenase n=1 Tax=Vermiconidia calcicola TaxID=1690605 RepID=A0AAV9PWZ6_9PEZI|nr:hypothetical protein LTR92_007586 [Exophiala xenobiotica]KAK5528618.1 hypothetical protein LTR25_010231 [Vermiconidia calcicola]KAK5546042.1 hypothetical protein LTR23_003849 [Chaetothyriales sp. CCFEE 6169]KAK5267707.1 hypothetical protein LTR96_007035 [Exophiala xenobiotica]KAK5292317.1 hypothetical protein LTR99_010461 [Exophiala xenobiotica]